MQPLDQRIANPDDVLTIPLFATDLDGDSISYSVGQLSGQAATVVGNQMTINASNLSSGNHEFTVTAYDERNGRRLGRSSTQTFNLLVQPRNPEKLGPESVSPIYSKDAGASQLVVLQDIASDSFGGYVRVWQVRGSTDSAINNKTFVQRYNADGTTFGSNSELIGISTTTPEFQIAVLSSGNLVVVYRSGDSLYFRLVSNGVAGPETAISSDLTPSASWDVSASQNGVFGVAYSSYVPLFGNAAFASIYNNNGSFQRTNFGLSAVSTDYPVRIATAPDGNFYVTHREGTQLRVRRVGATSAANDIAAIDVATISTSLLRHDLAVSDDGRVLITWESPTIDGSGLGIAGKIYNAALSAW